MPRYLRRLGAPQSVVIRLTAIGVVGGVAMAAALTGLELRRSERLLQQDLGQRALLHLRHLQSLVDSLGPEAGPEQVHGALGRFFAEEWVRGVRATGWGGRVVKDGPWLPDGDEQADFTAVPQDSGVPALIGLTRPTVLHTTLADVGGSPLLLELLVDGASERERQMARVRAALSTQWLLLAVLTLLGLLLMRRWFAQPLAELARHADAETSPEAFRDLARHLPGEFGGLARAIAGMLRRLRSTARRLHRRELAYADLYRSAPAALLSLDPQGRVIEANERARQLLGDAQQPLIGRDVLSLAAPTERARVQGVFDRLDTERHVRVELRLGGSLAAVDTVLEATRQTDSDERVVGARLSLLDISPLKRLQRELADQTRRLHLLINHIRDGVLLVGEDGRIVAHNHHLERLLHLSGESIDGQAYDSARFWDTLGVMRPEAFLAQLTQIEADDRRSAQLRAECRAGVFELQGVPVRDESDRRVGRLWVLRDVSAEEQSQRLLRQQTQHLAAFKRLSEALALAASTEELLTRAGAVMRELLEVEHAGLALRSDVGPQRTRQLIDLGRDHQDLEPARAVLHAVETGLMPEALGRRDLTLWSDLPRDRPWSSDLRGLGWGPLAAAPLWAGDQGIGVLWVARRPGQTLDRHHLYLLDTLAPVVSARIELTQMMERLASLALVDPGTGLPNRRHLELAMEQTAAQGKPWSLILLRVETASRGGWAFPPESPDDQDLATLAQQINGLLRRNQVLARWGVNTFAALCPGCDSAAGRAIALRLSGLVRQGTSRVGVQASAGGGAWVGAVAAASAPHDGRCGASLLRAAEGRLASPAHQAGAMLSGADVGRAVAEAG